MRISDQCMGEVVKEMMGRREGCGNWSFLASYYFLSTFLKPRKIIITVPILQHCLMLVALQILICVSSSEEK